MAQLITAVGGEAALPIVGQAARITTDNRLRAALVDVLVAAELRGEAARQLYTGLLADRDGQVRLSAIAGLEQIEGARAGRYLEVAAGLLADPEMQVRLRVLPALLAAEDPDRRSAGSAELRLLLKSPDPHTRVRTLQVVGQARSFGFLLELVRSLTDGADEVRLAAGLATETLAGDEQLAGKRDMLLVLALLLLQDPIERARLAAVKVLERLGSDSGAGAAAARESLVAGLADASAEVRERSMQALVRAGPRVIPQVHAQLELADPQLRKMAALVLARLQPHKYAALILGGILNDDLLAIHRNLGCLQTLAGCPGPAVGVLGRLLGERNAVLLDGLFQLLSAVRDPGAVEAVARSLRSPQAELRANAVEALESLTAPQTAALVGALFEPDLPAGPRLALVKQTWDLSITTPVVALRLLFSDASDAWLRTLVAAALVEMSASVDAAADADIAGLLGLAQADPDEGVRIQAGLATAGAATENGVEPQSHGVLSLVGKIILLQELPFFRGMTIDQLKVLAAVCEQEFFPAEACLFHQGDPGGVLYVVARGRVDLQQEKRKGAFTRLGTLEAHSYLGETGFFDNNCRTNSAIAIQDTLTLRLRREPLMALARQHPDLSLELINVLSLRLREANQRIAEMTQTHPRELQTIFDQLT